MSHFLEMQHDLVCVCEVCVGGVISGAQTERHALTVCYGDVRSSFSSGEIFKCFLLNYGPALHREPSFPRLSVNPWSLLLWDAAVAWENQRVEHHFLCCPLGSLVWAHECTRCFNKPTHVSGIQFKKGPPSNRIGA